MPPSLRGSSLRVARLRRLRGFRVQDLGCRVCDVGFRMKKPPAFNSGYKGMLILRPLKGGGYELGVYIMVRGFGLNREDLVYSVGLDSRPYGSKDPNDRVLGPKY